MFYRGKALCVVSVIVALEGTEITHVIGAEHTTFDMTGTNEEWYGSPFTSPRNMLGVARDVAWRAEASSPDEVLQFLASWLLVAHRSSGFFSIGVNQARSMLDSSVLSPAGQWVEGTLVSALNIWSGELDGLYIPLLDSRYAPLATVNFA